MENIQVLQNELGFDNENPIENLNKVISAKKDLENLLQSLNSLELDCKVRIWQKEIEQLYPNYKVYSDEEGFNIIINKIMCGIWIEKDSYLYWGFFIDNKNRDASEEDEEIIKRIITESGLQQEKKSEKGYIGWGKIESSENVIKKFIVIAQELQGCKIERRE